MVNMSLFPLATLLVLFSSSSGQVNDGSTNVVHNNVELSPVVSLKSGDLRAKVLLSRDGEKYYGFLGIPYASPPVHNMRFLAPSTPLPWSGIFNATTFGSKCTQYNRKTKTVEGQEDCLYLNVFVKQLHLKAGVTKLHSENEDDEDEVEKYPVLVFIHGGDFSYGDASEYSAKYFMDEPVIVVTFNYRLNVFGFLNTGEKESQGNMGLKDIAFALKWVQNNIDKFGGDKHRVVVFGSNSGGAAVHYLMLQNLHKGLMSGAISQSGNALVPWAFSRNPKRTARKLGAIINCPTSDMLELTFCLQGKDAEELVKKAAQIFEWNNHPWAPFGPSVETTPDGDKFLTASPYHLVSQKQESEVPFLIGVNEDEGLFEAASVLVNPTLRAELNVDWLRISPSNLYFRDTAVESGAVANQIRAFYFGSEDISYDTRKNLSNLYSDRLFLQGTRNTALLHSRINEAKPIHIYLFAYRNHNSVLNSLGVGEKLEVTHQDELQYLFHIPSRFPEIKKYDPTAPFSRKLIQYIYVQFANTSKIEKTWSKSNVQWEPISPAEVKGDTALRYFKIDEEPSIISEPFLERMNFWERLPLREYTGEETISPYFRNDDDDVDDEFSEGFFRIL